ncbi:MAG TPA: sigma 54-interacting transcriptional regulator [Anaeromyxobacteraceae bacterium]|nr:sigma 54-interacting transcriptional regulator [Anaeromyxobacteraceae bacterium]
MSRGRPTREVEALHEIGNVLSLTTDLSKAFTTVLTILADYLGMGNGTVSLFDPVTGDVFIEAAPEMADAERILGRVRPGEGVIGRVFRTSAAMVIPDLAEEPLFLNRTGTWRDVARDRRALLALPIRDGRATYGVLTVDRRWADGPFSFDRDLKLLALAAGMLATRIRLHQLESPVQRASHDDAPPIVPEAERFPGVFGASPRWTAVLELVARVAQSRATVFLRGESGTGKEVVARVVHDHSPRAARPFVVVNCAALPESLAESELFGHERGAFTGATQAHQGRFQQADGGTLFLDEVGELSAAMQVKLLRAIQERQFERVGGRKTITVDVRIVAATNRDMEAAVRNGTFRLDLYHRLSVVNVLLPPLRERREDIALLARRFLADLCLEHGRELEFSPGALELLSLQRWPGNVRELRNAVERAVISAHGPRVEDRDLDLGPTDLLEAADETAHPVAVGAEGDEATRVRAALERSGYVQAKAARLLGMTVRQLAYRVRKYRIELERF